MLSPVLPPHSPCTLYVMPLDADELEALLLLVPAKGSRALVSRLVKELP